MSFAEDMKRVLEIEREGKKRLAAAQEEARRILDRAREESRQILEEGERSLATEREKHTVAVQADITGKVEELEKHFRIESGRLSHLAKQNRGDAIGKILGWLWGES